MPTHQGGCLCGAIRFETTADPVHVTTCHCKFCQRATGGAYMVEPLFDKPAFRVIKGTPKAFDLVSEGSGKVVHLHFCPDCGGRLNLSFERFPDIVGVYAGAFDDPAWFDISAENAKHIFLGEARPDTVIPPGLPTFEAHSQTLSGAPCEAKVFDTPHIVGRRD